MISRIRRLSGPAFLVLGLLLLLAVILQLRLTVCTDYMYHAFVKDPLRRPPSGPVVVSPADGTVLYVRRITDGVIPKVVKSGVAVPMAEHIKEEPLRPFPSGYLIGIYMNTQGVHINRIPNNGKIRKQIIWNGPHMDMTAAEIRIILTQLIPGWTSVKKLFGLDPFSIENDADYILKSARETLVMEDERGTYIYIVRIADYYVGKLLTWVSEGETVDRGQKLGMITWGSQTDIFIEDTPGLAIKVEPGQYVYGGETVVATY